MPEGFVKPRYTAAHFKRLHNYRVKTCPVCGRRFGPKVTQFGTLEQRGNYAARLACSDLCKGVLIKQTHQERRDKRLSQTKFQKRMLEKPATGKAPTKPAAKVAKAAQAERSAEPAALQERVAVPEEATEPLAPLPELDQLLDRQAEQVAPEPTDLLPTEHVDEPTKSEPTKSKRKAVIDHLREQLPPKAKAQTASKEPPRQTAKKPDGLNAPTPEKISPPPKSVQQTKKAGDGPNPKPAAKVVQAKPDSASALDPAELQKAQESARKPYDPTVKSRPPGSQEELPQSFYNDLPRERAESEIERERRTQLKAGTWSPTPTGEKVPTDPALRLALFRAFGEHEEEVFLDYFRDEHPELVKDYERWRDMDPRLRERALAA